MVAQRRLVWTYCEEVDSPLAKVLLVSNWAQKAPSKWRLVALVEVRILLLSMSKISKSFFGVKVLHEVDLNCAAGEIRGLVGENGAGKSTLMNILAGLVKQDSGIIELFGVDLTQNSPTKALQSGVSFVHQELSLFPDLTVEENIYMGREPIGKLGIIRRRKRREEAMALLERVGLSCSPTALVGSLPLSAQQLIEIAKALAIDAKVIIFDEPTTALTGAETRNLFKIMRSLADQGRVIIFISHYLEEIMTVADTITVLRDGRVTLNTSPQESSTEDVIAAMVGRSLGGDYPAKYLELHDEVPNDIILETQNLCVRHKVHDVTLQLRKGEILGIAGLEDQGQSDLLHAMVGISPISSGSMRVKGENVYLANPATAWRKGIAFIPEDRKAEGLCLGLFVDENLQLARSSFQSPVKKIDPATELEDNDMMRERLGIRGAGNTSPVRNLSGGNQQKVVVGKGLLTRPQVIIFFEPTKGIDINSKFEIYRLMRELAEDGVGILIASTELPELVGVCDRVLVMFRGQIQGSLSGDQISEENIMSLAVGEAKTRTSA
jgi:ABC-type sugar transport system ATPase subunit